MDTPRERAILVGAPLQDVSALDSQEHMLELARLSDTAGATVVGSISQRLERPNAKYYIGEGKARELKALVGSTNAKLVIFDEELSPAQGKNLENLIGVRIMDRAELILDIFASRARTREAQMQVELAQLQYMLPRLQRMWSHLSRVRGGIGMRGPGEMKIETDRRVIGHRIRDLRRELEAVARRRATQRKSRTDEFRVALVGYTNAGKSSILRKLSGAELFVEDRLFATLDATTRAVQLENGDRALLTDTVGFIRKLPHALVASFRATLEETAESDVLLHVIDASHPRWEEHKLIVDDVLEELDATDQPVVLVFNKMDRLTPAEATTLRERAHALFAGPCIFTSALEDGGLGSLLESLTAELRSQRAEVALQISVVDGEALATVYREGEVLRREDEGTTINLIARLPQPALGRLEARAGVHVAETV